ncbi:MAG TPA: hypothetical protein VM433_06875 [Mycobacteriales bacterium]|nr:hypothetical protein [Mycobacteriales bacterium]
MTQDMKRARTSAAVVSGIAACACLLTGVGGVATASDAAPSPTQTRLGPAQSLTSTQAVQYSVLGPDGTSTVTVSTKAGGLTAVLTGSGSLSLLDEQGSVRSSAEGGPEVRLSADVPAGVQRVRVSGAAGAGYSLRVDHSAAGAALPAPTASTAPPPAGGYFRLAPVGSWSSLPSDAQAASMVRRSSWEPRPQNAAANATVPSKLSLGAHGGVEPRWNDWLLPRVTGNFTGTTDEIVQWAAAKWGLPDELLRGQMVAESWWHQGLLDDKGQPLNGKGFGDFTTDARACPPGYATPCPLSFGVLQIKYAPYHPGVFPHNRNSTAFNLDYAGALLRGCYEGWETWLRDYGSASGGRTSYAAGDLDGCLGRWYAGQWRTTAAEQYIASVQRSTAERPWLAKGF